MKFVFTLGQSVFEWTWKTSLSATLLMVVVFLLQKILAKWLTPRLRYTLSLLILIRLLLPFAPSSVLSFENLLPPPARITKGATFSPVPDLPMLEVAPVPATQISSLPASVQRPSRRVTMQEALCIVWASGCLCLVSLAGWRLRKWHRLLRQGQPISDPRLLGLLHGSREAMGARGSVSLVALPQLNSPAIFGVWKVRLLLPQVVLQELNDQELRMVFLHEMAHVRRRDVHLNYLVMAVQFLHWFNPLVWLAFHRLRADRELVCDAMVMRRMSTEERVGYGKVLLKLMEGFSAGAEVFAGAVPVISNKDETTRRIRMIKSHRSASMAACGATALLVLALGVSGFTEAPQNPVGRGGAPAETNQLAEMTQIAIANLKEEYPRGKYLSPTRALMEFTSLPTTVSEAENPALAEVLPILLQALKDNDAAVRVCALGALRKIRSPDQSVVKTLGNLVVVEGDLNIAALAASVLKETGPAAAPAVPDLIKDLETRNDDGTFISGGEGRAAPNRPLGTGLRRAVIEALGNIGPAARDAIPFLRKRLNDAGSFSLGNRVFSAKALWQITGDASDSLQVLAKALKEEDSFWAADIIGTMGAAARPAIPVLRSALQSGQGYTRLRAAIALHKIDPAFQLPQPLLLDLLKDENPSTRFEAAQTLWTMNHDSHLILPTLLGLLKPNDKWPMPIQQTSIEVRRMGEVRRRMEPDYYGEIAMQLLGEIGPPAEAAVPRLKEIIRENQEDRPHTSEVASEALKRIEAATAPNGNPVGWHN